MSKKLPRFHSEREEAEFWSAHDSTEFLDEFEDDAETVFVRPEKGIIEVGKSTWQDLLREAKRRRTTPARLANRWLRERLASEGG
jgi:hypothetical protein